MKLSELLALQNPVIVEWMGNKFTFGYTPRGYDENLYMESTRLRAMKDDDPRKVGINNIILTKMLVSWPFTDEEDQPTNPTEETIKQLPMILRGKIVGAIFDDMDKGTKDPKLDESSSSSGSSPEESSENAPTGTHYFEEVDS